MVVCPMRCTVLIRTADASSIQLTRTLKVSLHISCDWLDCFSGLSTVVTKPSEWNNIIRDSSIFPELAQIYGHILVGWAGIRKVRILLP